MHKLIEECVFKNDGEKFLETEDKAISYIHRYVGDGVIIQDDIFSIIKNYYESVKKKDYEDISILLFPIEDSEICGFICNYKGKLFIFVNTFLPLEKQIFTAAHELYHLVYNKKLLEKSYTHLIKQDDLEENRNEEQIANLFAALLLVPKTTLIEQLEILKVDNKNLQLFDIIRLMDVFAVPYKTIVLRLYEIGFIKDRDADKLLQIPDRDDNTGVLYEINKHEIGLRWQERTRTVKYGNLKAMIIDNDAEELISQARFAKDMKYIQQDIKKTYEKLGEEID